MDTLRDDIQFLTRRIADALRDGAGGYVGVVVPEVAGLNWAFIMSDPRISLAITNRPSKAIWLCEHGQPAIAIMGASKATIVKWLRERGANAITRADAH